MIKVIMYIEPETKKVSLVYRAGSFIPKYGTPEWRKLTQRIDDEVSRRTGQRLFENVDWDKVFPSG